MLIKVSAVSHSPLEEPLISPTNHFVGIWSHAEAAKNEVSQISSSGCGATAILNCLVYFNYISISEISQVDVSSSILRKRQNDSNLPKYLVSRSDAGCSGEELVLSLKQVVEANKDKQFTSLTQAAATKPIKGEFVPSKTITAESPSLLDFVADNINKGNVCIATYNLQLFGNDAWHHQMIYGVDTDQRTIHCMNPIESYPEQVADACISTDSVLLVRKEDIVSRAARPVEAEDWELIGGESWQRMRVRQQIDSMIAGDNSTHIIIPAVYVGGITVFTRLN
jgi:hypothetical protein